MLTQTKRMLTKPLLNKRLESYARYHLTMRNTFQVYLTYSVVA